MLFSVEAIRPRQTLIPSLLPSPPRHRRRLSDGGLGPGEGVAGGDQHGPYGRSPTGAGTGDGGAGEKKSRDTRGEGFPSEEGEESFRDRDISQRDLAAHILFFKILTLGLPGSHGAASRA